MHEPAISLQQLLPQSTTTYHDQDSDRNHADQHLHQSSISPIGNDTDRWIPGPKPWESQAAYAPSPEQQHAALSHDGQSISTTDLSSNNAGKSTPESQQTSDTSYRESEHPADKARLPQEGDDSFYWHSGRSSSEADGDHSQVASPTATPGESVVGSRSSATTSTVMPSEHQALPTRSTSLSPAPGVPYGASALGFGGPSDWEYFGDYEAEEIDDEELYSRPRLRDSASVKDPFAESPGDSRSTDYSQQPNEPETQDLKTDSRKISPLPERSPTRQPKASVLQEEAAQKAGNDDKSDHSIAPTSPSSQSTSKPHVILSAAGVASDMSPDQRPDLDDIIRAWSEAPHVGKNDRTDDQKNANINDEPPDVAEASLASTPQERMLGVDVILRDAPSLPKLPASLECTNPSEEQRQRRSEALLTDADILSSHKENKEQLNPDPKQPDDLNGLPQQSDPFLPLNKDHGHDGMDAYQTKHNIDASTGDEVSSWKPSHPGPTESDTDSTPIESAAINGQFDLAGTREDDTTTRRDAKMTLSETSGLSPAWEGLQNLTKRTPQEHLPGNQTPRGYIAIPNSAQENLQHPEQRSTGEDVQTHVPPESSRRASQEVSLVTQLVTAEEVMRNPSTDTPNIGFQRMSQGALGDQNQTIPSQKYSPEDSKAAHLLRNVEESHFGRNAIGASPEENVTKQPVASHLPIQGPMATAENVVNPYEDLDPWGKASLNRFAAMLREEARAESNKDKLNIFNVFTSRESRLRVVLYSTDDDLIVSHKPAEQKLVEQQLAVQKPEAKLTAEETGFVKQAVQRVNTMNLQRSLKALPALPTNRDSVIGLTGKALAPLVIQDTSNSPARGGTPEPSTEDSPSDGAIYSPGGRPIISRPQRTSVESGLGLTLHSRSSSLRGNTVDSPSSSAPIALQAEGMEESNKPPIRSKGGRSEVKNYLANRKSVCRPYATLTQGSLESGANFGREPDLKLDSDVNVSIVAPTSQYNPNNKITGDDASDTTIKQKSTGAEPVPALPDLRRFVKADFDPLVLALPGSEAIIHESVRLQDLKNVIDAVPDDFTFIHQTVVAWDAKAKKQREENDRQRHARQIESEQRIDSLFDDHEIGYGDISELEAEFKQSEAARRADEDRSEYQTFVADVFNVVWTRLHYELDQLVPHYEQYSKLMNDTLAGKEMFEGSDDGLALAPTMSGFLGLHQKLEIRHQKAFEAVLERDRRLKKTERSPWYTLGNIAKVKQLEKQFEDAEKKAIIEYCQQRDTRANRLMDVLDQNTLRGVGANQDYMEAIMKAVRRIASGRAFASVSGSNEPTAGLEEVEKAKSVTALLATSSEQIVQTFHVADMLLNSADYELSLAKAKVLKADGATLAKLKEERLREDQKLMRDLEHRLALIREDSRRTNDEIIKLMLFLGVQNGRADSTPAQAGTVDPGHEARIQKALEEAKKRNALKEPSG